MTPRERDLLQAVKQSLRVFELMHGSSPLAGDIEVGAVLRAAIAAYDAPCEHDWQDARSLKWVVCSKCRETELAR